MSDIREWTDALKYKPGWNFRLDRPGVYPVLHITAAVQHSETGERVSFDIRRLVPPSMQASAELFVEWVETVLAEAELHEMREFFRFYGQLVDSPHESKPVEPSLKNIRTHNHLHGLVNECAACYWEEKDDA